MSVVVRVEVKGIHPLYVGCITFWQLIALMRCCQIVEADGANPTISGVDATRFSVWYFISAVVVEADGQDE